MTPSRPRPDAPGIVACLLLIAVGGLAIWHSSEFSAMGSVFPRAISVTMIALSLAYIAATLLRPRGSTVQEAGSKWRRGGLMAVYLAWPFLLEPLGFLASSVLAYVAILVIANYDRWTPRTVVAYGLVGACVLGGLYAIFHIILQVPMPEGILL